MKSRLLTCTTAVVLFALLAGPIGLAAQDNQAHKHHHYQLIDIGTFPGLSIYNRRVTSNGSAVTEFQQILNNQRTLVGGADTPLVNPYGCFNPFNQSNLCYVQHAFVWQNGKLTDLGTLPGGSASFAYFLSDNGLIAGGSDGKMHDLRTLGGPDSFAQLVNNKGQVTGVSYTSYTPDPNLVGSSSRCLAAREKPSDDRPHTLKIPSRRGGIYANGERRGGKLTLGQLT